MKWNPVSLLIFFVGTPFINTVHAQQDIQFSQYIFNGLTLSPSYAGYKEVTNINLAYRSQWTGLAGAPQTASFSIDGLTSDQKNGLGFQTINDQLGAQSNLNAYASYAYRLLLGETDRLAFGLAAGVNQYKLDGTKLVTLTYDKTISTLQLNSIRPDLKAGISYFSEKYYATFSATDLFSNYIGNDPAYLVIYRSRHYYLQGGALFSLGENTWLKPTFLIKEDFKGPTNLDLNIFLLLGESFWIGGSYRTGLPIHVNSQLQTSLISSDALSLMVQYCVSNRFRIGYSFDYTTNSLRDVSNGSHEISIEYRFKSNRDDYRNTTHVF